MKKSLFKGLILGVIFVASIIAFSNMMNKDLMDDVETMSAPTLPVLYMEISDQLVNPMYGNMEPMQTKYCRDSITPITTKREMTVAVDREGKTINSVSYQVLTADDGTVVEDGKVNGFVEEDGMSVAAMTLEGRILMNQEYLLCFIVDYGEEQPAYYYTRIVQRAGLNASQYVKFVQDFYEKCLSKETASGLTKYIEPDDVVVNNSYAKLDIHSSFDQLTWGELSPTLTIKAIPTIKEINETTCSISQNYEITSKDSEDKTEHYQITEFYRMRYSQSRVMLIDFNRSATQVFDGDLSVLTSSGINLGIVDPDIEYTANTNGDIVAFAQAGELWSYNRSSNKASHIFGFRDEKNDEEENPDFRYDNPMHDIKVVRTDESGDVDFIVYGYMNRGDHEGETGISVCHYIAERNVMEEEIFIPCTISYDFLASDVETLSYISRDDRLYLWIDSCLYQIDVANKSYEVLKENVPESCIAVSRTQAAAAWLDQGDADNSTSITYIDFETGETTAIEVSEQERLRVLGFINEDLIYGIAKKDDIVTDRAENTTFAMYHVLIQSFDGTVQKEYQKEGTYVTGVRLQEGLVELTCVTKNGEEYEESANEEIMDNSQAADAVTTHLSVGERKGTTVALDFTKSAQSNKLLVLTSKYLKPSEDSVLSIELPQSEQSLYYIFANGHYYGKESRANQAILTADEVAGVVLNDQQAYIWERGNKQDKEKLTVDDLPDAVREGLLEASDLKKSLGNEYLILNLTGCTLDSVLYRVSQGYAVMALKPDGSTVAIVGYDSYNTILLDPGAEETYYYGINDSTAMFEEAGNVFFSYVKNRKEQGEEKNETDNDS